MLNHLFDIVKNVNDNNSNSDGVDKLNSRYCAITLLILATFVVTNQLVGDVIDCWTPNEFGGQWVRYTDTMCWVSNTYYLPIDITPEEGRDTREMYEIKYYQWVPIILAVQALLFFLPSLVWGFVADSSIDISNIVNAMCDKNVAVDPDKRDTVVKNLSTQFHRYIKNRRQYSHDTLSEMRRKLKETNSFCLACGSRYGNYLGLMYLFTKALFVFNAWAQLFSLDSFLGPKFYAYGIDVLQSMWNGIDWTNSKRFPRVTLCDFEIRKLGNITPYTVQCVMSINLFNERIFLFVWFMLLIMAIVNTVNFGLWLWRVILRKNRYEYIRKHLTLMERLSVNKNLVSLSHFVDRYLQHDGVFIIRLMSKNSTSLVISEMTVALFDTYMEHDKRGADEESFIAAGSPKVSMAGLGPFSRRGSLKFGGSRKNSMPPAYTYGRNIMSGFCKDEQDDDTHSRGSSGSNDRPVEGGEPTPEEVAYIRKLIKKGILNPSAPPPPPPQSISTPNAYTAQPTMPAGYQHFLEDSGFDHPKAKEAFKDSHA